MDATADTLKRSGNVCFQAGDFVGADKFYTQAIIKDPTNAAYFTNRALARVRMARWDAVVADCEKAIELLPSSLKAYTYLGSAQLKLGRPAEALAALRRAYQLAIAQRSPSVAQIAASCLDAKKARWEQAETARIRSESALLAGTQDLIMRDARRRADAAVATAAAAAAAAAGGRAPHGASTGSAGDDGSNLEDDIMEAARSQCRALENVFGQADAARLRRRDVPDWLVDNITFGIMWDPVVTKHGHSYDRSTLIDHLRRSPTDPLTREPLCEADLRPNLALKAACDDFLKNNGWAVDW